jgi:hypothetical protein
MMRQVRAKVAWGQKKDGLSETNSMPDGSAMLICKSLTAWETTGNEPPSKWLGHADARQVSDLPDRPLLN